MLFYLSVCVTHSLSVTVVVTDDLGVNASQTLPLGSVILTVIINLKQSLQLLYTVCIPLNLIVTNMKCVSTLIGFHVKNWATEIDCGHKWRMRNKIMIRFYF